MALTINRLTDKSVQAKKASGLYLDGNRLYLQVGAKGARSWVFRYKRNRRAHDMGLGSLADVSLATARKLAAGARDDLAAGPKTPSQRETPGSRLSGLRRLTEKPSRRQRRDTSPRTRPPGATRNTGTSGARRSATTPSP